VVAGDHGHGNAGLAGLPNAYAAGETYIPDGIEEPSWYKPVPRGLEIKIAEKMSVLKRWDEEAGQN
jgi:putative ATPase